LNLTLDEKMGKQLKINELKRVVNVDTFSKHAHILNDCKNANIDQIEYILNDLSCKTPSKDILMKTRLGFILKKLASNESLPKHLRQMARNLRQTWKEFHKRLLLAPKCDVKCDKPTNENRMKAREFVKKSLIRLSDKNIESGNVGFDSGLEKHLQIVSDIEFKIYQLSDTIVNERYFDLSRKCMKELGENPEFFVKLIDGKLNVEDIFVKLWPKKSN